MRRYVSCFSLSLVRIPSLVVYALAVGYVQDPQFRSPFGALPFGRLASVLKVVLPERLACAPCGSLVEDGLDHGLRSLVRSLALSRKG